MNYAHLYTVPPESPFTSWWDLKDYYNQHAKSGNWRGWIYRGHRDSNWDLATRIERAAKRFGAEDRIEEIERGMMREFWRKAESYISNVPNTLQHLETLAIIQHHGGPTRLLDFTYSFYVAAFFSLEKAEPRIPCSIWALDAEYWTDRTRQIGEPIFKRAAVTAPEVLHLAPFWEKAIWDWPSAVDTWGGEGDADVPDCPEFVLPMNPHRIIERQDAQRGVFVVPGNLTKPFMQNLAGMHGSEDERSHILRIDLDFDQAALTDALTDLDSMQLTRGSLFPGIDGFVAQFENQIAIRGRLYLPTES